MNKNIKKIFTLITLTFLGMVLFWSNSAFATTGSLIITFEDDPLFKEADLKPGDSVSRWVEVSNNTGEIKRIITEAINYPGFPDSDSVPTDDLSRVLMIVISKNGTDLYGGSSLTGLKSLYNFYQDSENYLEIYLSDIGNGETIQYDFTISFPYDEGNEWQEKTTGFDILIGSQGETNPLPPSPPSPPSSGGGALPQGLTILDESVVTTNLTGCESCSITINWNTNYFSTSRIVYSKASEPHIFDLYALNYGYSNSKEGDNSGLLKVTSHSVTITGLSPDTTYYFRCESHASPPSITGEFNFTTVTGERCVNQETGGNNEEDNSGTPGQIALGGESGGNQGLVLSEVEGGVEGNEFTAGNGGQGQQEEGVTEEELEEELEKQTGKDLRDFFSGGLASLLDVIGKIGGNWLIILLLIIILVLLFLLFKKRKKEEEK